MEEGKDRGYELASNLSYLRKKNKYSQEKLAELLEISRQSVSKWEAGINYPDLDKLMQLSKLYQITIDALLNVNLEEADTALDVISSMQLSDDEVGLSIEQIVNQEQDTGSKSGSTMNHKILSLIAAIAAIMGNLILTGPLCRLMGGYGLLIAGALYLIITMVLLRLCRKPVRDAFAIQDINGKQLIGVVSVWMGALLLSTAVAVISSRLQRSMISEIKLQKYSVYEGIPIYVAIIIAVLYAVCSVLLCFGALNQIIGAKMNRWLYIILFSLIQTGMQPWFGVTSFLSALIFCGVSVYLMYHTKKLLYLLIFHGFHAGLTTAAIIMINRYSVSIPVSGYLSALVCAILMLLCMPAVLYIGAGMKLLLPSWKMKKTLLSGSISCLVLLLFGLFYFVESKEPVFIESASIHGLSADSDDFNKTLVVAGTGKYTFNWEIQVSSGVLCYEIIDENEKVTFWGTAKTGYGTNGVLYLEKGVYTFRTSLLTTKEELTGLFSTAQITQILEDTKGDTVDVEYQFTITEYPGF